MRHFKHNKAHQKNVQTMFGCYLCWLVIFYSKIALFSFFVNKRLFM